MTEYIVFFGFVFIFYGSAILYCEFGLFKRFYHDILKWHKPTDEKEFDGCNTHSHCKYCGKEIMQDSQGNWF